MKLVTDFLRDSAARFPQKTAFSDSRREITYAQLLYEAEQLGCAAAAAGPEKKPAAIYLDKSVECICAMQGVLLSGNFYTVLDTHMPEARIEKILEILEPSVLVTDRVHLEKARELLHPFPETIVIVYEEAVEACADRELLKEREARILETDTMYVLFTSGSTGTPKGVIISHKAVVHYLKWCERQFGIDDTMVLANQAPLYFVMTTLDVYLTIYTGAVCHIVPVRYFSFPMMLLNYLQDKKVNTLYVVPSVLCYVANTNSLPELHLKDLKLVLFGGEVMPVKQLNMWIREYPEVTFVNLYGSTEITDIITYYIVDRELDESESLPIGKTADHMKTMILDENREVPYGEVGELCGTGPSLADGYYHMPEKTAEVFTDNPLYQEGESQDFRRIYHMGDLVRLDKRGDLIYVGRKDFQIKHMGHRIELGEIETAVSSLEGVERNCCLHDKAQDQIVLFYSGSMDEDMLNEKLAGLLPDYMVPTRYEKLPQLPLNLNGKIDREQLKQIIQ